MSNDHNKVIYKVVIKISLLICLFLSLCLGSYSQLNYYEFNSKSSVVDLDSIVYGIDIPIFVLIFSIPPCQPCDKIFNFLNDSTNLNKISKDQIRLNFYKFTGHQGFYLENYQNYITSPPFILVYSKDSCLRQNIRNLNNYKNWRGNKNFIEFPQEENIANFIMNVKTKMPSYRTDCKTKTKKYASFYVGLSVNNANIELKEKFDLIKNQGLFEDNSYSQYLGVAYNSQYGLKRNYSIILGLGLEFILENKHIKSVSDSIFQSYNSLDNDEEEYEKRIKGISYTEFTSMRFIALPISIKLSKNLFKNTYGEIEFSAIIRYNFNNNSNLSGNFSYSGYYPQYYNSTIYESNNLGFSKNNIVNSYQSTSIGQLSVLFRPGFNLKHSISNSVRFIFGLNYNYSKINVLKESQIISDGIYDLNSPLSQFNYLKLSYWSVKMGLEF